MNNKYGLLIAFLGFYVVLMNSLLPFTKYPASSSAAVISCFLWPGLLFLLFEFYEIAIKDGILKKPSDTFLSTLNNAKKFAFFALGMFSIPLSLIAIFIGLDVWFIALLLMVVYGIVLWKILGQMKQHKK